MQICKDIPLITIDLLIKFYMKIDRFPNQNCHIWSGKKLKDGYGRFLINGKEYQAHRVAYFIHNKTQPGQLLVCHTCDNPPCCNPQHLFLGTNMENRLDMLAKGRGR